MNKFKPQKARGAAVRLFNRLFEERKICSSLVSDEQIMVFYMPEKAKHYFKSEKISIRYIYYAYFDTKNYLADSLFIKQR